jgi:hypothetical protein
MQLAICLSTAGTFCVAIALIALAVRGHLETGLASYLAVALASFTAINGGYWIIALLAALRDLQTGGPGSDLTAADG